MPPKKKGAKTKAKITPEAAAAGPTLTITAQMQALIDGGYTTKKKLEEAQKEGARDLAQVVRRASEKMTKDEVAEQFRTLQAQVKEKEARIDEMKKKKTLSAEAREILKMRANEYKELAKEKEVRIDQAKLREKEVQDQLMELDEVIKQLQADVSGRDAEILELAKLKTERVRQKEIYDKARQLEKKEGEIRAAKIKQAKENADNMQLAVQNTRERAQQFKGVDGEMFKKTMAKLSLESQRQSRAEQTLQQLIRQDRAIRDREEQEQIFEDDISRIIRERTGQDVTIDLDITGERPRIIDYSDLGIEGYGDFIPHSGGPRFEDVLNEATGGLYGSFTNTASGVYNSLFGGVPPTGDLPVGETYYQPPSGDPPTGGRYYQPPSGDPPSGDPPYTESETGGTTGGRLNSTAGQAGGNQAMTNLMAQLRRQKDEDARLARLKGARNIDDAEIFNEMAKEKLLRCAIAKETYNQGIQSIINKSVYDAQQRNIKMRDEYKVQRRSEQISRDNFLF